MTRNSVIPIAVPFSANRILNLSILCKIMDYIIFFVCNPARENNTYGHGQEQKQGGAVKDVT